MRAWWQNSLLYLDEVGNLLPLREGGIHARGVVRACVEENDCVRRESVEVSEHVLKVQATRGAVVVAVLRHAQTGKLKHWLVVACAVFGVSEACARACALLPFTLLTPRGIRDGHNLRALVEAREKLRRNAQPTGDRHSLDTGHLGRSERG